MEQRGQTFMSGLSGKAMVMMLVCGKGLILPRLIFSRLILGLGHLLGEKVGSIRPICECRM